MNHNQDWRELAIKDLTDTDLSYDEIGQKYGRDRDTIIKLKRLHNLTRKLPPRKGPRKITDRKEISSAHRAVGIRLSLFRGERSYAEVAERIGVSALALRYMELGIHDLTLAQLLKISELLGQSISELTSPFTVGSAPKPTRKIA